MKRIVTLNEREFEMQSIQLWTCKSMCDHVVEEEIKVSWIQLELPGSDFCECACVD